MRTSPLPNFRKLWGRLPDGLPAGKYYLEFDNNYNVHDFDGTKKFVVSNNNSIGGKNYIMSACYFGLGVFCFIFAIFFGAANVHYKDNK